MAKKQNRRQAADPAAVAASRKTLEDLGFTPSDAGWLSAEVAGYELRAEVPTVAGFKRALLDYGAGVGVEDRNALKLWKPENLVTLECVMRLLELGYAPDRITLEKRWKVGHGGGRLDVLVSDEQGAAFAMIECKAWGKPYADERSKTLDDGGQLFGYFNQDRAAKHLVLYQSRTHRGRREFTAESIETGGLTGGNRDELFASWDGRFILQGLFNAQAGVYASGRKVLCPEDLLDLDEAAGEGLFHSFLDILRRHAVSDKTNAFNKIFSLFVCKLRDEGSTREGDGAGRTGDHLKFQVFDGETDRQFLEKLGKLYEQGLVGYLGMSPDAEYFRPAAEFNFVDVFDSATHLDNVAIVREVVELLQPYRLRYATKQQFLGDFFERLLTTGLKQEAGQFFTPEPLARFIAHALPFEDVIERKVEAGDEHVLPYVVDYACGAGHFLTEAMAEIDAHLPNVEDGRLSPAARRNFRSYADLNWVGEYVYGVERDHRLAKTTKVALFLHGDGEAAVVHGNGLSGFDDTSFKKRLSAPNGRRDLAAFDLLLANPPFSVDGFKRQLPNGKRDYSLFPLVSTKGGEIECLFVERAVQLLRPGGMMGVILPLGMYGNGTKLPAACRTLLLLNVRVAALVGLGGKTFPATISKTTVLFGVRRTTEERRCAAAAVDDFLRGAGDHEELQATLEDLGVERTAALATWQADRAAGHLEDDYLTLDRISRSSAALMIAALVHGERVLTAYPGDSVNKQAAFLGYKVADKRRGNAVDRITDAEGRIDGLLYSESVRDDPAKIAHHVRVSLKGDETDIPETLQGLVAWESAADLVDVADRMRITIPAALFSADPESLCPYGDFIDENDLEEITLKELETAGRAETFGGLTFDGRDKSAKPTPVRVITAEAIDKHSGKLSPGAKLTYLRSDFPVREELRPRPGDIVVSLSSGSPGTVGKAALATRHDDGMVGGFLAVIRCKNGALAKAVFYRLLSKKFRKFAFSRQGQLINNINIGNLRDFPLELPKDLDGFLAEAERIETEGRTANKDDEEE